MMSPTLPTKCTNTRDGCVGACARPNNTLRLRRSATLKVRRTVRAVFAFHRSAGEGASVAGKLVLTTAQKPGTTSLSMQIRQLRLTETAHRILKREAALG